MSSMSDRENTSSSNKKGAGDQKPTEQTAATGNKWQKIAGESQQAESDLTQEPGRHRSKDEAGSDEESASADTLGGIEFASRHQIEDQLTALEMKCDEYKSQSARMQAELANMRKRAERDIENAHKYGVDKLITSLLPVADSLARALEASGKDTDPKLQTMREGMSLTLDMLHNNLAKFGVSVINPTKGAPFNPELHEAVSTQADASVAPNSILQVLQRGYQLNDRVLRAAIVVVSQG